MTEITEKPGPDQPASFEERIARLEASIATLTERLDREDAAAASSGPASVDRSWREQATRSFEAASDAFIRVFERRPVLAIAGLVIAAVVLVQLLD